MACWMLFYQAHSALAAVPKPSLGEALRTARHQVELARETAYLENGVSVSVHPVPEAIARNGRVVLDRDGLSSFLGGSNVVRIYPDNPQRLAPTPGPGGDPQAALQAAA